MWFTPKVQQVVNHESRIDLVPAGRARATLDPPTLKAPGIAAHQDPPNMDGHQLVQWLTVRAGDMACTLQHRVRL